MQDNQSRMTNSILIAGLLGGLLGGVVSFALNRTIKPAPPQPATGTNGPASGAREAADAYVAKLKAAKFEEFIADARQGATFTTEEGFAAFKTKLINSRTVYTNLFGSSSGEFELLRETALSPSLIRLVYLEKFERGCVWWMFVLYHGRDSWKLAWVDHGLNVDAIFAGLS
jgi:hypothetical protein